MLENEKSDDNLSINTNDLSVSLIEEDETNMYSPMTK